jgi:integron integrase
MSDAKKMTRAEASAKFGPLWFKALANFHKVKEPAVWKFDEQHVIDFLRSKLQEGTPTWKRLRIVEGLIWYRNRIRESSTPPLEPIRAKLQEILVNEKHRRDESTIEDLVGKINPRESDVIQSLRRTIRVQRLSYNTEKAYVQKVRAFMSDRGLKCLADFESIGGADVEAHLTDLAVDGDVAPSTQNQAFHALLYLFQHVLKRDFGRINALRSTKAPRIPSVMSKQEVVRVFGGLRGVYATIGQLLYGTGMRMSECLRLRVKDIDFDQRLIEIHNSKGDKSRFVPLPEQMVVPLRKLIEARRAVHEQDMIMGEASVWLPHALARKYPAAHSQFKWQFIFASTKFSKDPKTGKRHRHHLHSDTFPEHLKKAVKEAGIEKHVTSHTFRQACSYYISSLRMGYLKGNSGCNGSAVCSWRPMRTACAAA